MGENFNMVNSLENIDKSKVSADRIEGLDAKIQEELSTAVTGAASTIITSDLTANKLLISNGNGKVAASTITSTDIDKVFSYYGTCSTAANTQTKDVVCSGFVLKTGSSIRVKFTNYQNYNGVFKLNVNSTGAKEVKRYGTTNSARYDFRAGEVISFTYDGTYWLMEDEGLADTTYFGKTKLEASATSTSTSLALTPSALNSYAQNTIANYPVYSTSSTYAVGDRVRYNWQTWECKTAITTAESWNASHWTALLDLQTQIDNIGSGSSSSRNIGEIVASTIPLTDAGLHLLDGGVIQRGSYADFVDYIAGLVSTYPDLFATESNWQTSVDTYGVCDKFVYDSSAKTVRLPKRTSAHGALIKSYQDGTDWYRIYQDGWCEQGGITDAIYRGNSYTLTFPMTFSSIPTFHCDLDCRYGETNEMRVAIGVTSNATGTAYVTASNATLYMQGLSGSGTDGGPVHWSAYGYVNISDLQQSAIYEYIVIATQTKTDIQVDIDEITTDLNAKVDKADLSPVHVVVDTYVNGSSWYRIYDDGWVEQGGIVDSVTANTYTSTTVNFLVPFINTNYTVLITQNDNGQQLGIGNSTGAESVHTKSTTNFVIASYSWTYGRNWYACGMGA